MSETLRKWFSPRMFAGVLIGIILSVATFCVLAPGRQSSKLTDNLGGKTWAESSAQFDSRLKRRFPIGTKSIDVIHGLARDGFNPGWNWESDDRRIAVRREDNFVCNIGAYAYWRTDSNSRLTEITGEYREEGCL